MGAALTLAIGVWWNVPRNSVSLTANPHPGSDFVVPIPTRNGESTAHVKSVPARSGVTAVGGANTLILQAPTGNSRVHFFWVYPAYKPEGGSQSAAAETADKGGRS